MACGGMIYQTRGETAASEGEQAVGRRAPRAGLRARVSAPPAAPTAPRTKAASRRARRRPHPLAPRLLVNEL